MKKILIFSVMVIVAALTVGCASAKPADSSSKASSAISSASSAESKGYKSISQDEAYKMMSDDKVIILDVRTEAEYNEGHITNAVLLPNEEIGSTQPEILPDKDAVILVYCRSGNRSKQASQKLADMGYTNIYEFGGINTWQYSTEK